MIIVSNKLHGDYQLANGYGHAKAKEILKVCKTTKVPHLAISLLLAPHK